MPELPDIYPDRLARMSPEELAQIRIFITSPAWVRFLRVIATLKPSSNCAKCGSGERDQFSDARANARLGEVRGWELYEFAIYAALNEPKEDRTPAKESFPNEGRIDAGWDRQPIATAETPESEKPKRRKR